MFLSLLRDVATASYSMGVLRAGALEFQTLELPWLPDGRGFGGKEDASCVPAGLYDLALHDSTHHPKSFALVNHKLDVFHEEGDVPVERRAFARTDVLLHVANVPSELLGCIGLGMRRGQGCIQSSSIALTRFKLFVPWTVGHTLLIAYEPGVGP